jgi:uncharacterized OB-fold protein
MFDPTVPVPDRDSAPYWSALAEGRFEIQHCLDCDGWSWPPRPICAHCQSDNLEWKAPSGKGEIHSWVRLHRPIFPALKDLVPFKIVDVRLDEAPNILIPGRLLGDPEVEQGTRVRAVPATKTDEVGELLWELDE